MAPVWTQGVALIPCFGLLGRDIDLRTAHGSGQGSVLLTQLGGRKENSFPTPFACLSDGHLIIHLPSLVGMFSSNPNCRQVSKPPELIQRLGPGVCPPSQLVSQEVLSQVGQELVSIAVLLTPPWCSAL